MCAPSFLVCARLVSCARAPHVHSLEGTLDEYIAHTSLVQRRGGMLCNPSKFVKTFSYRVGRLLS